MQLANGKHIPISAALAAGAVSVLGAFFSMDAGFWIQCSVPLLVAPLCIMLCFSGDFQSEASLSWQAWFRAGGICLLLGSVYALLGGFIPMVVGMFIFYAALPSHPLIIPYAADSVFAAMVISLPALYVLRKRRERITGFE